MKRSGSTTANSVIAWPPSSLSLRTCFIPRPLVLVWWDGRSPPAPPSGKPLDLDVPELRADLVDDRLRDARRGGHRHRDDSEQRDHERVLRERLTVITAQRKPKPSSYR